MFELYTLLQFNKADEGSNEKVEAQKKLQTEISRRQKEDDNIHSLAVLLFGETNASRIIEYVRPTGQPLVDDWDCLKMLVSLASPLSLFCVKFSSTWNLDIKIMVSKWLKG